MLAHDGVMRRYFLHVSPSSETSVPLVVNMHGYLSGAQMQEQWSMMNAAADPRGIVTAHPEGLDNSWNAGTCCGDSATNGVDDVGFIRAVVADIESAVCVDPRRVYATGMSNGAYMSYRLACEASDVFAAVAPVAGALGIAECTPPRAVPVLAFLGVQDPLVPYAEGTATIDRWVELDGCSMPQQSDFEGGNCKTWSSCADDGALELCTLDPMGHCWPGGAESFCFGVLGQYSAAIDATATMLDFFAEHRLP
jgi:polyhydroxybutyrate depolymerase